MPLPSLGREWILLRGKFVVFGILFTAPALADTSGPARVIDGDTIHIGDVRVRLLGVDAPEGKQSCERDGVTWLCGQEAGRALRELVGGQDLNCVEHDLDRYKRSVSVCTLPDGTDIGAWMVSNGHAVACAIFQAVRGSREECAQSQARAVGGVVSNALGVAA